MGTRWRAAALLVAAGITGLACPRGPAARPARAQEPTKAAVKDQGASTVPRPSWKVGDTWVIETVTDRIQDREAKVAKGAPIRWQFHVAAIEQLVGRDCFRVEITCQAMGRVRPEATIWVDTRTLAMRQMRTQLAFAGAMHPILESYDPPSEGAVAVLTPLNALPIDLPAFLPAGSKGLDMFTYTSQPLPAGSKDPGILRFAHTVKQDVAPAGAKALGMLPSRFAKDLEQRPVVEVRLQDHERTVTQLWQPDRPWPVVTDNGRTRATLVSVGPGR